MKISRVFVLFLFLLVIQSIPSATGKTNDLVYDTAGGKVRTDFTYYIGPVNRANVGGVKLSGTKNGKKICPFNVVLDPEEVNGGSQFYFTMTASTYRKKLVRVDYALGIDSGMPKSSCDKSTFWKVNDVESNAPSNFITTGGKFEEPESCFQLVKYPKPTSSKVHSYMLQHCPYSCGGWPQTCFNVSIYDDHGTKQLVTGTGGTPFEFMLKKASK